MGLFSGKTVIKVFASANNLAGPFENRPSAVNSSIVTEILTTKKPKLGTVIQRLYSGGPPADLRKMYRWTLANYPRMLPDTQITSMAGIDPNVLISGLNSDLSPTPQKIVHWGDVDVANAQHFADNHIDWNHLTKGVGDWTFNFNTTTNELVFFDIDDVEFDRIPANADLIWVNENKSRRLLYIGYSELIEDDTDPKGYVKSKEMLYTYRIGSGNVIFDTITYNETEFGEFFPILPLRYDNKSIREPEFDFRFDKIKTAYKKATKQDINKLLDEFEDIEDIDDIDYAYIVPGVALNTKSTHGARYIYKFFSLLDNIQASNPIAPDDGNPYQDARLSGVGFETWFNSLNKTTAAPLVIPTVRGGSYVLSFGNREDFDIGADLRLEWKNITVTEHLGNAKFFDGNTSRGRLKKNQYWIYSKYGKQNAGNGKMYDVNTLGYYLANKVRDDNAELYIFEQYAKFRYKKISVTGCKHHNYVYKSHAVTTSVKDAFDAEDEETVFIIPLHYPTMKNMALSAQVELGMSCMYGLMNAKVKYKTGGLSKLWVIIGLGFILGALLFGGGAALGGGSGLLGTNSAVGAMFGLTGTIGNVVGALANAIVGSILRMVITEIGTKLFGEEFAMLFSIIMGAAMLSGINIMGGSGIGNMFSGGTLATSLVQVTNAIANIYARFVQMDTADIYKDMEEAEKNYTEEMKAIAKKTEEMFGINDVSFDPTDLLENPQAISESMQTFINRTILTGSDIARITHSLIEDYVEVSQQLPKHAL